MKKGLSRVLFLLSLLSHPAYAAGSGNDDLPVVQFLSCQGQCANFVPAKPLALEQPRFPSDQANWTRVFSEGAVKLLYTIGPDGKVRDDVMVLSLIGPREFADLAIEKIRTWTFEPATSNGKPVSQSRTQSYTYLSDPRNKLFTPGPNTKNFLPPLEVVQALKAAPELVQQGKPEEARAKLDDVLKNVRLTFSDRMSVASALAELAYRRADYLEARRLAVMATAAPTPNMPAAQQQDVWRNRIKADLKLGEIPDTLVSLTQLQKMAGNSDSTLPKLMQTVRETADTAPLLTVQAEIPPVEDGDVYTYIPYRRSFTFQNIQGALQKFVLSCNQATMESEITPTAQWRIPDHWDGCSVYVRGTPGTKFLVEQPKE